MNIQSIQSSRMPAALLRIGNASACARWVEALPIEDEQTAHRALAGQLAALRDATITPHERLRILEALKETVYLLQAAVAKRYTGKALPLDKADTEAWQMVVAVWWGLVANYRCCLDAYREGDMSTVPQLPAVIMRSLRILECILCEHYRVYRQPDPAIWREIHQLTDIAETHGILSIRVEGLRAEENAQFNCAEAYIQSVLLDLADPHSLSPRQLGFVRRWIEKWSSVVGLSRHPSSAGLTPPLAVDLAGSSPIVVSAGVTLSPSVRYLDMDQLSRMLRQILNLLKQGSTPGQLGLGEDARQPGCEALIMLLYVRWCRTGGLRNGDRRPTGDSARIGFGSWDAWTLVSSNPPPELANAAELNKEQQELLDDLLGKTQPILQWAADYLQKWTIVDQSASGFMCELSNPAGTTRILHNQLLAVQFASGKPCVIGTVQWLRIGEDNGFQCGVRLFGGIPQVIMARQASSTLANQQKFEPAMLLPEIAAPATQASIVLPAGLFESGRLIELKGATQQFVRLYDLLDRGSDFDRGTFVSI